MWTFGYQPAAVSGQRLVQVADPAGRVVTFTVDAWNHLVGAAFPDGSGRGFYYDARGLLTQQVDQGGHVTGYSYDAYGRVASDLQPQRAVYDPQTGQTEAAREVRTFSPSDTAYTLINDSAVGDPDDPAPAVPTSTLLADGAAFGRGGVSGHTDRWGRWVDETDGLGRTTSYERDAGSNVTLLTWPIGNCVEADYDETGHPLSAARMGAEQCSLDPGLRDPAQVQTVTLTYEPRFKQIKTLTDPLSRTTTYYYDYELELGEAGKLVRVEYPPVRDESGVLVTPAVSYTYNAWGLLETETDENGTLTRYVYTQAGLLTQVIQDEGGLALTTVYTDFDALTCPHLPWRCQVPGGGQCQGGNALTVIGPGGEHVTRYRYDVLRR